MIVWLPSVRSNIMKLPSAAEGRLSALAGLQRETNENLVRQTHRIVDATWEASPRSSGHNRFTMQVKAALHRV